MKRKGNDLGPSSLMSDLLEVYPWAQRALFRKYHIGGCSSCAFKPDETLAMLCERNDSLDPAEVLQHIRESHAEDTRIQISPKETADRIQRGESIRLLDIRTKEEWDVVRLPAATRMSQESMQDILTTWPREGLMVIYDHLGKNSLNAATYFQGQGFANVRCLTGGIDAWSQEVDSSVRRYRLEAN
ncbi:MAG: putative adenylyltransferase/sulfurtransferase MoeZ [Verrucomicrobia subdivision 3 bacterium]|nr:putative adenylyltransferase/sulfurtransferase MoeZ [Limisphaerales bacterium]MCS1415008.1 putative adenylyltransferase/sulfurtransferase MoeZ [Limisphaerales bacterium]